MAPKPNQWRRNARALCQEVQDAAYVDDSRWPIAVEIPEDAESLEDWIEYLTILSVQAVWYQVKLELEAGGVEIRATVPSEGERTEDARFARCVV